MIKRRNNPCTYRKQFMVNSTDLADTNLTFDEFEHLCPTYMI